MAAASAAGEGNLGSSGAEPSPLTSSPISDSVIDMGLRRSFKFLVTVGGDTRLAATGRGGGEILWEVETGPTRASPETVESSGRVRGGIGGGASTRRGGSRGVSGDSWMATRLHSSGLLLVESGFLGGNGGAEDTLVPELAGISGDLVRSGIRWDRFPEL